MLHSESVILQLIVSAFPLCDIAEVICYVMYYYSGQLRMAQISTCMECVRRHSKLITVCACVNQLYLKGCCINCDYITLALELPRIRADWMRSKFNVIH